MKSSSRSKPSKTKQLARDLGLLPPKRKAGDKQENGPAKRRKGQVLNYLIVIDFESTCWENRKGSQEIIEFPAVLLDLSTGKVLQEFHHYVCPTEHPVLSTFCKELTGISQSQVDGGIPLPTCLYLFNKWVQSLKEDMGVVLMEPGNEYTGEEDLCAIATWTDWDLGVCLKYECSRKQIRKSAFFNQWIDIRAVYKSFYERNPSGLSGALEDLGMPFIGKQHSGIDDARNTAKLCYRIARDGYKLAITKCIQKQVKSYIRPPTSLNQPSMRNGSNVCTEQRHWRPEEAKKSTEFKNELACHKNSPVSIQDYSSSRKQPETPKQSAVGMVKEKNESLDCNGHDTLADFESIECQDDWDDFDSDFLKDVADEIDNWEEQLGHFANKRNPASLSSSKEQYNTPGVTHKRVHSGPTLIHQTFTPSRSEFISHVTPFTLLPCAASKTMGLPAARGFYGADKESVISENRKASKLSSASHDTLSCEGKESCVPPNHSNFIVDVVNKTPNLFLSSRTSRQSVLGNRNHRDCQDSSPITNRNATPYCSPAVIEETPPNQLGSTSLTKIPSRYCMAKSTGSLLETPTTVASSFASKKCFQTPNTIANFTKTTGSPKEVSSFASKKCFQTPDTTARWHRSKQCFSPHSLSDSSSVVTSGGKITPPLCRCGRRAKRKIVTTSGPNEGRPFYACPNGRGYGRKQSCEYFRWEVCASDFLNSAKPLLSEYE